MACTILRTLTDAENNKIYQLYTSGMTLVRIAVTLDLPEGYVRKSLFERNVAALKAMPR